MEDKARRIRVGDHSTDFFLIHYMSIAYLYMYIYMTYHVILNMSLKSGMYCITCLPHLVHPRLIFYLKLFTTVSHTS